jgi:hypothetical protein
MRRRPFTALGVAPVVALALGACGGGSSSGGTSGGGSPSGVGSQSASQIVTTAGDALRSVSSVHLAGDITEGSKGSIGLDLKLVPGKGAVGSMTQDGATVKLVINGQQVYLNGGAGFWKKIGGAAAAEKLTGRWIKGPSSEFGGLADELEIDTLLKGLLDNHGGLAKGAGATVDGQKVISVVDRSKGGTLYVAADGKPYPIEVTSSGSSGGKLTFDDFNAPVTITPPAGAKTPQQLAK